MSFNKFIYFKIYKRKTLGNLLNWVNEILDNIQCSDIFKEYIKLLSNPDKFLQ